MIFLNMSQSLKERICLSKENISTDLCGLRPFRADSSDAFLCIALRTMLMILPRWGN